MTLMNSLLRQRARGIRDRDGLAYLDIQELDEVIAMLREAEQKWPCAYWSLGNVICLYDRNVAPSNWCPSCAWKAKLREEVK
jgi:hypothetical protein